MTFDVLADWPRFSPTQRFPLPSTDAGTRRRLTLRPRVWHTRNSHCQRPS